MGLGQTSGHYIVLNDCKFSKPLVCATAVHYMHMDCVEGIVGQNSIKLSTCLTEQVAQDEVYVIRLNPDELKFMKGVLVNQVKFIILSQGHMCCT